MNQNVKKMEMQCWLEEYRSLRVVIESHFTSVRYLVIFNLTALGTIGGLVLSNTVANMWVALIIPILSPFIGFLVYFHGTRMSQIEYYIKEKIVSGVKDLIEDDKTNGNENEGAENKNPEVEDYGVLGWESYIRDVEKSGSKFFRWFSVSGMSILTFTLTSLFVLIFTAKQTLTSPTGWQVWLWIIGLLLTLILIAAFIIERDYWLSGEYTFARLRKQRKLK